MAVRRSVAPARPRLRLAMLLVGGVPSMLGCPANPAPLARSSPRSEATVHYLEIVTHDVDATCALYEGMLGVSFGVPDPDLGQARAAMRADGSVIGIRKPLAEHESPIVRTYVAVTDIAKAVETAAAAGATVAYPPTKQGTYGTFAIVIANGVEHGLWQR